MWLLGLLLLTIQVFSLFVCFNSSSNSPGRRPLYEIGIELLPTEESCCIYNGTVLLNHNGKFLFCQSN